MIHCPKCSHIEEAVRKHLNVLREAKAKFTDSKDLGMAMCAQIRIETMGIIQETVAKILRKTDKATLEKIHRYKSVADIWCCGDARTESPTCEGYVSCNDKCLHLVDGFRCDCEE